MCLLVGSGLQDYRSTVQGHSNYVAVSMHAAARGVGDMLPFRHSDTVITVEPP